jgi:hypothetical protein
MKVKIQRMIVNR